MEVFRIGEKILGVVELLGSEGELSFAEIRTRLSLSKASAHRALSTLREVGWVTEAPETRRYRLGLSLWELGRRAVDQVPAFAAGFPTMQALSTSIGSGVNLAVLHGDHMLHIAASSGLPARHVPVAVAARSPLHVTASGKVALAFGTAFAEVIPRLNLERFAPRTVTDRATLLAQVSEIRVSGYAICQDERTVGRGNIAAPVFSAAGRYQASLAVAFDAPPPYGWVEDVVPRLLDSARELSALLGDRRFATDNALVS